MSLKPREAVKKWTIWAILAEPYLDTEHDQEWKDTFAAELRERGITGFSLRWRQAVAAFGLWWNILWWEWASFDGRDIVYGWVLNVAILGAAIIPWFFGWLWGLAFFIGWLIMFGPILRVLIRRVMIRKQ